MGFDRIWAVEHHCLKWYAHMSAPEIFLTWVAAQTSTIRIGHGVVCMPFNYNHPVRVAERAAMLDVAVGRAARPRRRPRRDAAGDVGVRRRPRRAPTREVEESLRMIADVAGARTSSSGTASCSTDRPPHPILPAPGADPHPPLFMACTKQRHREPGRRVRRRRARARLRRARRDRASCARSTTRRIATRTGERFVSRRSNDHFSALCPTIVLDDRDEALRVGARGQRFFAEAIAHWYGGGPPPERGHRGRRQRRRDRRSAKERHRRASCTRRRSR